MKKNSKGFTLIELLAVIVILAIIALIATPIVLNLISKARRGAAEDSGYGLRKSAQLYYTESLIDSPTGFTAITFTCGNNGCTSGSGNSAVTLSVDGTRPTSGTVSISATGTVTTKGIVISNYYCVIPGDGKVNCYDTQSEAGEHGWEEATTSQSTGD